MLRGISQSFSEFLKEYNLIEGNLKESFLINNPVITRGDRDTRLITFGFFQDNVPRIPVQDLLMVTIQDIADENLFLKRKDDIELPLSLITYMRLQAAFHLLRLKLRSMVHLDQTGHALNTFMKSFKKGSQSIRRIFSVLRNGRIKPLELNAVITFFQLVNTDPPDVNSVKLIISAWDSTFMTNKQREFSFRFYNNTLGLNNRLAHFVQNINPGCAFCLANNADVIHPESFLHLFFDCFYTNKLLTAICNNLVPELVFLTESSKKLFWFCGIDPGTGNNNNSFLRFFTNTIMFTIWEQKKKNRFTYASFLNDFMYTFGGIYDNNKRVQHKNEINLSICRTWDIYRDGQG